MTGFGPLSSGSSPTGAIGGAAGGSAGATAGEVAAGGCIWASPRKLRAYSAALRLPAAREALRQLFEQRVGMLEPATELLQ